jgi:hypothetical protein
MKNRGTLGLIVTSYLLCVVGASEAVSIGESPRITVIATNAVQLEVHYTPAGSAITIDAVVEADGAFPRAVDVYVGIISPDGQSFSFAGTLQAPVLVNGPPVPLLRNVVLTSAVGSRLVIPNFPGGGPRGWYVVYGLIVTAGSDPSDPRGWVSSSFFPLLVTTP